MSPKCKNACVLSVRCNFYSMECSNCVSCWPNIRLCSSNWISRSSFFIKNNGNVSENRVSQTFWPWGAPPAVPECYKTPLPLSTNVLIHTHLIRVHWFVASWSHFTLQPESFQFACSSFTSSCSAEFFYLFRQSIMWIDETNKNIMKQVLHKSCKSRLCAEWDYAIPCTCKRGNAGLVQDVVLSIELALSWHVFPCLICQCDIVLYCYVAIYHLILLQGKCLRSQPIFPTEQANWFLRPLATVHHLHLRPKHLSHTGKHKGAQIMWLDITRCPQIVVIYEVVIL